MSWFCKDELGPNFNMVSKPIVSGHPGHPPFIHAPSPMVLGARGRGGVLIKPQVPHWIDKTFDKSL